MPTTVDARGLPCPQPVILTRQAMSTADQVLTLVSERDQVDNVLRLAERAGWQTRWEAQADGYAIHLIKGEAARQPELTSDILTCNLSTEGSVVVLSSERMGRGNDELGAILMRSFLYTLTQVEPHPKTLVLYNTGVQLAIEGSPVLDELRKLAEEGVEILVCGTCLGYFELKERLAVGTLSNMYSIAEALLTANRVITI